MLPELTRAWENLCFSFILLCGTLGTGPLVFSHSDLGSLCDCGENCPPTNWIYILDFDTGHTVSRYILCCFLYFDLLYILILCRH